MRAAEKAKENSAGVKQSFIGDDGFFVNATHRFLLQDVAKIRSNGCKQLLNKKGLVGGTTRPARNTTAQAGYLDDHPAKKPPRNWQKETVEKKD